MSKGIELTPIQIKAYEEGATMFLFPIEISKTAIFTNIEKDGAYRFDNVLGFPKEPLSYIIDLPIKKGDKGMFVQEEFRVFDEMQRKQNIVWYRSEHPDLNLNGVCDLYNWQSASQMTKEQSRYSFSECVDVKIVRANYITLEQMEYILGKKVMVGDATPYMVEYFYETYNQQLKEQNINRTYEDNDYVFLVEFKR